MKQYDILDSIGDISDDIIEDVIDYTPQKKSKRKTSARRLSMIAVAATLCVVLTVTCFANADGIRAAFNTLLSREQMYIDPYAHIINKNDTDKDVTMTVKKVVKDGDDYILYIYLHNETEYFAEGYLTYDRLSLDYKSRGETCHYGKLGMSVIDGKLNMSAGSQLEDIRVPTKDINIQLRIPGGSKAKKVDPNICCEWESGLYHFEITNLAVLPYTRDEEGDVVLADESIDYADKLEIDFDYDEDKAEGLPATVVYPNKDFELDGTNFRITKIVHTASSLKLTIEDMDKELLEYGDLHFWGTAKLDGYISPIEYPWIPIIDDTGDKTGYRLAGVLNEDGEYDEVASKEWSDKVQSVKKEYKLYDSYFIPTIIYSSDDAWKDCRFSDIDFNLWPLNPDGTLNMNVYEMTFHFKTPTSINDIQGIVFRSWEYDYSQEELVIKRIRRDVIGWINSTK